MRITIIKSRLPILLSSGGAMTLTETGYRPRLIDPLVKEYLESFGAVSIEGLKFCGKTWTALNHAESVFYLMDSSRNYANRRATVSSPTSILVGSEPRLIDEWQEVPGIWDATRFKIDRKRGKGRFLLTGSAIRLSSGMSHKA
jgi:predicted AAA+ superfamily ATPase